MVLTPRRLFGLLPIDIFLCTFSFASAWVLSLSGRLPQNYLPLLNNLPLVLTIRFFFFWYFRMYNGLWRFASVEDLLSILKAISASSVVLFLVIREAYGFSVIPPTVFIIDTVLLVCLIGGFRFSYRILREVFFYSHRDSIRCLIVGAGGAGATLVREIKQNPKLHYQLIGFIDDDPQRQQLDINGVPVVGKLNDIAEIVKRYHIEEVIISFNWNSKRKAIELIQACRELSIRFKIATDMGTLLNGKSAVNLMNSIEMKDLLIREPVELDNEGIISLIRGRCVMVTGAGGSIGSELCRQLLKYNPKTLVLFERMENNLYNIELALRKDGKSTTIIPVIGDVTDFSKVNIVLKTYRPSVIYHAAAHKQVPLMELQPEEAIKNNILGTRTIATAAHKAKVDAFVFISTDKAVNPTSIMGTTKRVGEMFVQELSKHSHTKFITVRFGNVLDSTGSVVPLFKKQILNGGPLTVTHPEVKRFFMTIPEASQLVIQASAIGKGGEIFVLNMGEQVRIVDLAHNLITFCGLIPGADIDIVYTGLRPGEKLYEELFGEGESMQESRLRDIKIAAHHDNTSNWHRLNRNIIELEKMSLEVNRGGIIKKLQEVVTNYQPCSQALSYTTKKVA